MPPRQRTTTLAIPWSRPPLPRRCTGLRAAASPWGSAGASLRFSPAWGWSRSPRAQIRDVTSILRRLWRGEAILGHDGPAGRYPYLHQDADFDEDIPLLLVAMGQKTLELAGECMDAVVLHTFFGDEALTNSVASVRRGAERAGRDPSSVRVWSVLATVGDHIDEAARLKKTVGRLASYLRGYGDVLVAANGWDPGVLAKFRADPFVQGFRGAFDAKASTADLEYLATLIPDEWMAAAATGTPEQCSATILRQFSLGADSVILHGATPSELAPILPAYRAAASCRAPDDARQSGTQPIVNPIAGGAEDLSAEWLSVALGTEVSSVSAEQIGTGQTSSTYLLHIDADGCPPTLVAKLAEGDEAARRQVATAHRNEVGFYTRLADTLDVRAPSCWFAAIADDGTQFTLLLEDLAPRRPGRQVDGCALDQMAHAVHNLAALHACRWNDDALRAVDFLVPLTRQRAEFLGGLASTATDQFISRFASRVDPLDVATLRAVAEVLVEWQMGRPEPFTVVHGDYRLDNLMFPPIGSDVVAVDWQTVTLALPARDLSYFIATSLPIEERRRAEEMLVETYHDELLRRGVEGLQRRSVLRRLPIRPSSGPHDHRPRGA